MGDTNVNVLNGAVKVVVVVVDKTKKQFQPFAKNMYKAMVPIFKEKKMSISKPTNEALDLIFIHCLKISDLHGELISRSFADRVPVVRQQSTAFLLRCLKHKKCDGGKGGAKGAKDELGFALVKMVGDSDSTVRKNVQEILAEMVVIMGKGTMSNVTGKLESSDPKKYAAVMKLASNSKRKSGSSSKGNDDEKKGAEPEASPPSTSRS